MKTRVRWLVVLSGLVAVIALGYWQWSRSVSGTLHTLRHYWCDVHPEERPDLTSEMDRLVSSVGMNDVERMSQSRDPFDRIMAGLCIAERPDLDARAIFARLKADTELFDFATGSMVVAEPVGVIIDRLTKDGNHEKTERK